MSKAGKFKFCLAVRRIFFRDWRIKRFNHKVSNAKVNTRVEQMSIDWITETGIFLESKPW